MSHRPFALSLFAVALAACPGPQQGNNPPQFWIAPDGSELKLKLVPVEPPPF